MLVGGLCSCFFASPFPYHPSFSTIRGIRYLFMDFRDDIMSCGIGNDRKGFLLPQNKLKYSSGFFALPKENWSLVLGVPEEEISSRDDFGIFERTNVANGTFSPPGRLLKSLFSRAWFNVILDTHSSTFLREIRVRWGIWMKHESLKRSGFLIRPYIRAWKKTWFLANFVFLHLQCSK